MGEICHCKNGECYHSGVPKPSGQIIFKIKLVILDYLPENNSITDPEDMHPCSMANVQSGRQSHELRAFRDSLNLGPSLIYVTSEAEPVTEWYSGKPLVLFYSL